MVRTILSSSGTLLGLQLVAVAVSLGALAFYPPASGKMMLVPVLPGAGQGLAARAIDAGALLVERGPIPNSLVISGTRADFASAMLAQGVLIVTAPQTGCGGSA